MKKLMLVLLISLFFAGISQAYTAQTKGAVTSKFWKNKQVCHNVWIDGDVVTIANSPVYAAVGDDVLISVEINGPYDPKITIIYVFEDDGPPNNWTPPDTGGPPDVGRNAGE